MLFRSPLRYFLGIEIARSSKGIVLSQRKYVLNLLVETSMLGCRPIACAESGDLIDKEAYQKLVERLIYLCHTRPDISYAVSVVSRYMHDARLPPTKMQYPEVDLLSSTLLAQSASQYPSTFRC